jgi:phosphoglycolate phosphatase
VRQQLEIFPVTGFTAPAASEHNGLGHQLIVNKSSMLTSSHTTELIIFDLDGTLIDSQYDLAYAVNYTLAELGLPPIRYEHLPQMLGSGLMHLIQTAAGSDEPELLRQARQIFDRYYAEHNTEKTRCYAGVPETLAALSGYKKAVYSNKMQRFTEDIVHKLGLAPYFDLVLGAQPERFPLKPDPAGILLILAELSVAPARALILGDSTHDIEAGRAAGLRTGAVTYGYRPAEALAAAGPDFMIGRFEDLCLYL